MGTLPGTNMEVENGPEWKTIFHYKQVVFHFHVREYDDDNYVTCTVFHAILLRIIINIFSYASTSNLPAMYWRSMKMPKCIGELRWNFWISSSPRETTPVFVRGIFLVFSMSFQ